MGSATKKRQGNIGPLKATKKLHQMMSEKISAAVDFASRASIYNAEITATELTTAQSILLSLMHSLLTNDLGFCVSLLEVSTTVDHLRSSYLPTWLKDDFNFADQQVVQVISKAALLFRSGLLLIPSHILRVFIGLVPKYRVVECCKASGSNDVLEFLAEFGIQVSSGNSQTTFSSMSSISSSISIVNPNSIGETSAASGGLETFGLPLNNVSIVNPNSIGETSAASGGLETFGLPLNNEVIGSSSLSSEASAVMVPVETPFEEVQEVWVEGSDFTSTPSPVSTSSPASNNVAVTTSLYVSRMREYLKVPEDFEEDDLMSLITYSDTEGSTPLHNAVKEGDPYVVECLLALGAKVDATDSFGYTPAHCAASVGSLQVLRVLAQHRANLSLARQDGCTPLHEAIINGHAVASKWLLDHGADINARNSDGWAPLHLAAQWDQLEIVKFLLDNGADTEIYNNNGKTPIDVAREEGNQSIVQLLTTNIDK